MLGAVGVGVASKEAMPGPIAASEGPAEGPTGEEATVIGSTRASATARTVIGAGPLAASQAVRPSAA